MPKKAQLELMKKLMQDDRSWISLGKIVQVYPVSPNSSRLRVRVQRWPELMETIATMTWEDVGPESGIFSFPSVNDLVLMAFAEGSADEAFVIKRLTSGEDKIPIQALDGDLCLRSKDGKKLKIVSNEKVSLQRGTNENDAEQALVLGGVFQSMMSTVLEAIANHVHPYTWTSGAGGGNTSPPTNAGTFSGQKASPVDDGAILSDLSFTEK